MCCSGRCKSSLCQDTDINVRASETVATKIRGKCFMCVVQLCWCLCLCLYYACCCCSPRSRYNILLILLHYYCTIHIYNKYFMNHIILETKLTIGSAVMYDVIVIILEILYSPVSLFLSAFFSVNPYNY